MPNRNTLGGIIHTYQKYDPVNLPAPTRPPPDLVSPALEHFLMFGDARRLTDEELARAIHLDPSQIAGLGPSLDALVAMLLERKRKILAKFETESVQGRARKEYQKAAGKVEPPPKLRERFKQAIQDEQLRDLELLEQFAEPGDLDKLEELQRMIENYVREMAERQGLERDGGGKGFRLTPKAYRLFQGRLLERIFSDLKASRSGRHQGPIVGEGAVEMSQTKQYEFGDSL